MLLAALRRGGYAYIDFYAYQHKGATCWLRSRAHRAVRVMAWRLVGMSS